MYAGEKEPPHELQVIMAGGKRASLARHSIFFLSILTTQSPGGPVYCLPFPQRCVWKCGVEAVKGFQILGERCCFKSSPHYRVTGTGCGSNLHHKVCSEMKETEDRRPSLLLQM